MKAIRKSFILQILMRYEERVGRFVCVCVSVVAGEGWGGNGNSSSSVIVTAIVAPRGAPLPGWPHHHQHPATTLLSSLHLHHFFSSLPPLHKPPCLRGCRRVGFTPSPQLHRHTLSPLIPRLLPTQEPEQ